MVGRAHGWLGAAAGVILLSNPIALSDRPAAEPPVRSPRVAELARSVAAGDRAALERFWSEVARSGSPLVEAAPGDPTHRLVTFVYRGDSATRNVMLFRGPNATMDLGANPLYRVPGTDLWQRSYLVRSDARFTYMLGRNIDLAGLDPKNLGDVIRRMKPFALDPLNPRRFPRSGEAPPLYLNSVVELPDAPPNPWIERRDGTPAGTVTATTLASRPISVYTPPGFDPADSATPYDLLIVLDGPWYLSMVPTPVILDNLIAAGKIAPLVAVFVSNPGNTRGPELHCSRAFSDLLATEILPWAMERYRAGGPARRTIVAGSSAGGLAATCAALHHPDRFGNVLSMSGAYWWHPAGGGTTSRWLLDRFAERPRGRTRFFLTVGLMEAAPQPEDRLSMLDLNRRFRDALRAAGYQVTYAEFNGGHEYLNWAAGLADGLIALGS